MRVLVTGGLGVNGAWTVRELLHRGHTPITLDTREDLRLVLDVAGEFERHHGDVTDVDAIAELMRSRSIELVAHLAAVLPAERDPHLGYRVNAGGTVSVLEAARRAGVARVVFTSSKAVFGSIEGEYGHPHFRPLAEGDLPYGVLPAMPVYSAAKILSEQAAAHYREAFGLSVLALRFSTIYGPGKQARHSTIGVLSRIVESALDGEGTAVDSGADAADDLVYVRDVAASVVAACLASEPEHWTFNIGSGRLVSLRDYCDTVREAVADVPLSLEPGWDYLGVGCSYALMDITRARRELGYEPAYGLGEGIRDYADSLRGGGVAVK